jgi:hypothetical protein
MKIVKVSFTRKFNLGNYESLDLHAEAELSGADNPPEIWTVLRDNTEMWFRDSQKKPVGEQQNQPAEPKPEPPKEYFKAGTLKWFEAPPTDKGPWEKLDPLDLEKAEAKEIIKALESAGKPLFSKEPNALYWLLKDVSGKVTGIGRRRK